MKENVLTTKTQRHKEKEEVSEHTQNLPLCLGAFVVKPPALVFSGGLPWH
jgi:hypothetical protein